MVNHYLTLDTTPELAVFRSRLGLTMLELTPETRRADVLGRLTSEATTHGDGYVARNLLEHPLCREELSHNEISTLSATINSAGLGQGHIPARLKVDLQDATSDAAESCERHLIGRASTRPNKPDA